MVPKACRWGDLARQCLRLLKWRQLPRTWYRRLSGRVRRIQILSLR